MILLYIATVVVFFAIDMVWLGLISKNFYATQLGYLMRSPINWSAAVVFYLLFIVGILFFAVYPAIQAHSILRALYMGMLFGFFTYATYDLTNYATIRDWPFMVTIVDMIWGTVLCGAVASASYFVSTYL
jgi:uncharacterized membrane protein